MPKLSIIIVNYNTAEITKNCLLSLMEVEDEIDFEVIIVDNNSTDNSVEEIKQTIIHNTKYKILVNKVNLGFAKGNNAAANYAKGKYILFLNSDTVVFKNTLKEAVEYLENNKDIGALTCKTVLPNGKLDLDARRSFPTPWVALTHFSYLDRIFPSSKIFAKYWYGHISEDVTHEVDVLQGAFFLSRREVLDQVGWFSEDYFLDGEDIDLSWKIKDQGYKIIYYPKVSILHIKKASKKKHRNIKAVLGGVRAMEIFYKSRLANNYPFFINWIVLVAISLMKVVRVTVTFLQNRNLI